jgi:hypothetical protein
MDYKDVLREVTGYVSADGFTGTEVWQIRWALADKLGDTIRDRHGNLTNTYCGQVLRALNALAGREDFPLVGFGKGDQTPWGTYIRSPVFYTPAEVAAATERARQGTAEAALEQAQWNEIRSILSDNGFDPLGTPGTAPTLSLQDWERLTATMKAGVFG